MSSSIAVDLVQKCELSNKYYFRVLIDKLSPDDFRKLCKEIMFLREYYDSTVGLYCSDKVEIQVLHPDLVWQLDEIDFDADINFKKMQSLIPKVGDSCNQMYDGRLSSAQVIKVNTDSTFDVMMSFGEEMLNIPFSKFNP